MLFSDSISVRRIAFDSTESINMVEFYYIDRKDNAINRHDDSLKDNYVDIYLTDDKKSSVKLTTIMYLESAEVLILESESLSIFSNHINRLHLDSATE